jgi:hypothetical protein
MATENTEVRAGVANGTQATFEGVMLKFGKTSSKTAVDGVEIDSVFASDISYVVLKHSSGSQKNNTFQMVPKNTLYWQIVPSRKFYVRVTPLSKNPQVKLTNAV